VARLLVGLLELVEHSVWHTQDTLEAACGVPQLSDSIDIFLEWAQAPEG